MWSDDKAKRLGQTLRQFRGAAGLSQEALAHSAGITKNQLQLLEAGRASGRKDETGPSNPGLKTLDGLAGALGVTVAAMLAAAKI